MNIFFSACTVRFFVDIYVKCVLCGECIIIMFGKKKMSMSYSPRVWKKKGKRVKCTYKINVDGF